MKNNLIKGLLAVLISSNASEVPAQGGNALMSPVEETIHYLFDGVDLRDWPQVRAQMADELWADYSSMTQQPGANIAADQLVANWEAFLPGFQNTYHQLGHIDVNIEGDQAHASFRGLAMHYLPGHEGGDSWTVYGQYDVQLSARGEEAWVIDRMVFNFEGQGGNEQLPALAQENASAGKTFTTAFHCPRSPQRRFYFL